MSATATAAGFGATGFATLPRLVSAPPLAQRAASRPSAGRHFQQIGSIGACVSVSIFRVKSLSAAVFKIACWRFCIVPFLRSVSQESLVSFGHLKALVFFGRQFNFRRELYLKHRSRLFKGSIAERPWKQRFP